MYRLTLLIYGLCLTQFLSAQQLICPPNETKFCFEALESMPQIIDGSGLNLQTSQEFSGTTCNVRNVINIFSLVDLEKDSIVSTCRQTIIVRPFEQAVSFPGDTIVFGYTASEIFNQSVFNDGIFPLGTNECNIEFTFEDVSVEAFPELYVFRMWRAENLCTEEVFTSRQRIALQDIPNGAIATQVEDCSGAEIVVDGIEVYINDQQVSLSVCNRPFLDLHQVLNCTADSLLVDPDDSLRLELGGITNPYLGVSSIDLVNIQRHILGLKRFESDCRLGAADVNRDGKINGIDLVEARKLILGIYTSWPYGDGPEYYVNGELRKHLVFTKADFPLSSLKIVVANQANVSTN